MTPDELKELETLEEKYLNRFYHFLMYAKDDLFKGFQSGNKIRHLWRDSWNSKSSFDKGAERIVYSYFNTQGFGTHNSNPASSDLFFETDDAFINIDLKTYSTTNPVDAAEKHIAEPNQSTYSGPLHTRTKKKIKTGNKNLRKFNPNLKTVYDYEDKRRKVTKPCLTYFIVIICEDNDFAVPCMYITCMPNGELREQYGGEKILGAGKRKNYDVRYYWGEEVNFKLLKDKKRIRVIHLEDTHKNKKCWNCNDGKVKTQKGKNKGKLQDCPRCNGTAKQIDLISIFEKIENLKKEQDYPKIPEKIK